ATEVGAARAGAGQAQPDRSVVAGDAGPRAARDLGLALGHRRCGADDRALPGAAGAGRPLPGPAHHGVGLPGVHDPAGDHRRHAGPPAFPAISRSAADDDHAEALARYSRTTRMLAVPMMLCTAVFIALSGPIMWVIG